MKKYVVFKAEEWDGLNMGQITALPLPEEVPDAIVLRKQDVFAYQALMGYAGAVQTAIEVGVFDHDTINQLGEVRDYFADEAQSALVSSHKLPD